VLHDDELIIDEALLHSGVNISQTFLEQSLLIGEVRVERHRPMSKRLLAKSSTVVVRGLWRWMIQIAKFPNLVVEPWTYRISGSRQQLTASSREQQTTVDHKPKARNKGREAQIEVPDTRCKHRSG
jgi:hypothetical protein